MNAKLNKIKLLIKDFGIIFSLKYCWYKATRNNNKYIELVYNYMCGFLKEKIKMYNTYSIADNYEVSKNIWVCWWQGEESMPVLCKMCYENLKKNTPDDYKLNLITKDNYQLFTDIPQYIIDKLNANLIPITQFSDILRQNLLYKNGGIWIDSSIWCTPDFVKEADLSKAFWSVKLDHIDNPEVIGQLISRCKWGSFLMGGAKGSLIYKFVFESMCDYYREHDFIIDYFLQNLLIRVGYENISEIRKVIDGIPLSNSHIYDLYRYMDEVYDESLWNEMCSDTAFFKLTQKRPYEEIKDGKETFYKHLKEASGVIQ